MTLRDLAFLPCPDHIIMARQGDRIALALGATVGSNPTTFDTVAWIRGTPPDFAGIERITVAEAFSLVGKTPPDTATAAPPPGSTLPIGGMAVLLAGLMGGVIAWRRVPFRS